METKRMAAAIGLSASTVLFGPSQAEVAVHHQQIQAGNFESPHAFVPDYSFGDSEMAAKHIAQIPSPAAVPLPSAAPSETRVLPPPSPESTDNLPASPYSPNALTKKIKYVRNVLAPLVKGSGLEVTISDAGVIAPGEFRVFGGNSCAVQFYVNTATDKRQYSIVEEVWGEARLFRRNVFRHAVYTHGMLSHAESNPDYFFAANRPALAAKYAVRTYALLCHIASIPARH